jgi:hypothetical protein
VTHWLRSPLHTGASGVLGNGSASAHVPRPLEWRTTLSLFDDRTCHADDALAAGWLWLGYLAFGIAFWMEVGAVVFAP